MQLDWITLETHERYEKVMSHITNTHPHEKCGGRLLIKESTKVCIGEIFYDRKAVLRTLPHYSEDCGLYDCICSCILSMVRGMEDCTCAFPLSSPCQSSHAPLFFVPVCCLSTFFLSPHHACLSSLPSPFLSLLVQGDESGCVRVWKSTPRGFTQPAAWKIHDAHKGVCGCLCLCVSVYACVFSGGNGKKEQGETEKKENRRGDKGTECETNWWSTAGLTL